MSDIDEVNEVIQDARRAPDHMPWGHHDRAAYLDELGVTLGDRFSITRDADDLAEAIRVSREAVNMTPMDSPERAGRLSDYGIRLAERHSMTEQISDIRCAIDIMRQILDITPNDPHRAMYMNNLGTALADQYTQGGRMADLDESIETTHQAINLAVKDWVATGIMTKFPLHAAGRHDGTFASVLDRAMSSYGSSIKTIIQSRRRGRGETPSTPAQALLVAMKHTPEQACLPSQPGT